MPTFADRLIDANRQLGHCLCVGLDPHLDKVPAQFRSGTMSATAPSTVSAVESFLTAILGQLEGKVRVIKPQVAFFEQLGYRGIQLLSKLTQQARRAGFLVIMDAKRGDIGSTANAYARTYLAPGSELESDALTINPYLGMDSIEPFIACAEQNEKGLFVLVKTSNPGSADFQDLQVNQMPLCEHIAEQLAQRSVGLKGQKTRWSGLGAVVGATQAEDAPRIRTAHPSGLFLVPGFGAQGGSAADAVLGFTPGDSGLEGGVVNASRSILFPSSAAQVSGVVAWEKCVVQAIEKATGELSEALRAKTPH